MKHLIVLMMLFPLFAATQECKLIRETDPFTRETMLSTGFIKMNGGSVTVDANKSEIDVLFSLAGSNICFDNNSQAEVYFEGIRSKTSTRNGGTMNCEGLFHFVFRNSRTAPTTLLQRLTTYKVKEIIFISSDRYQTKTTVTLNPEQQELLMFLAKCLVDEARGLL